jgi:hypothetical protein
VRLVPDYEDNDNLTYGFSGCVDTGVVYPRKYDSLDVNLEEVACRRRYSIYAMAPPTNANPTTPPTVPAYHEH